MHTRETWRIGRAGSVDRLARQTEALSDPGPGEARILVRAVGLNFADVFAVLGLYSATPPGAFVPGLEVAGIVDTVGPAAPGSESYAVRPGDRVMGLTRFGAYASAVNIDVRCLRHIPPGWSFAEGAAFPVQALTAWYGLIEQGDLVRGDLVLLHSAAGGVGLHALALLAHHGARVVATVGRPAKREFLMEHCGLAADQVIVRDRRNFSAQLDRALVAQGAGGFDLVLDPVAGPYFRPAYDRLRPAGRLVLYGVADFMSARPRPNYLRLAVRYFLRPRLDPLRMISENRSVMAFNLIWLWDRVERLPGAYDQLAPLMIRSPFIGRRFRFSEAPAALGFLQSGQSIGKVVLDLEM